MVEKTRGYQLLLVVLATTGSSVRADCLYQPDADYSYGTGTTMKVNLTKAECCQLCTKTSGCFVSVHSTDPWIQPPLTYCWLKDHHSTAKPCHHKGAAACFPGRLLPTPPPPYVVTVTKLTEKPVISAEIPYLQSDFEKVSDPSWIVASEGSQAKHGLLIRSQNCSGCKDDSLSIQKRSVLTFAELIGDDRNSTILPTFKHVSNNSVVFGPADETDEKGVEDPRIVYDYESEMYYMFYTCVGKQGSTMCLASSKDPTNTTWVRHGQVGFGEGAKSGALLIHKSGNSGGPHFLFWGSGKIRVTQSQSLLKWTPGSVLISHIMGNPYVEAGPPPMELSTGDYIFFINSWDRHKHYQPAWVILDGKDPTKIIAHAQKPLFDSGDHEYLGNKAFVTAAHPAGRDAFRIYFGGADKVIGSGHVKVSQFSLPNCGPSAPTLV